MIIGLLVPILVIVFVVMTIRRASQSGARGAITGNDIRRFFQYLLLYALVILSATGAAGLLGQLFSRQSELVIGSAVLARNLSFVVVGVPLVLLLASWVRRTIDEDVHTTVWTFYTAATSLTALILVITGINNVINPLLRTQHFDGNGFAQLVVWSGVWAIHWRIDRRTPDPRMHHIVGSLIGLIVTVIGLATLLGGLFGSIAHATTDVLVSGYSPTRSGLALLISGLPVWWWYWIRTAYHRTRDDLWNAYVLLAGVAGGLIMAVVAASTVIYQTLVWFIGDPSTSEARRFFTNTPMSLAIALTGVLVWWYHQAVLAEGSQERSEVRRIYEYLISGIAIISAAVGISILVVSGIEALTRSDEVMGQAPVNTLLSALTLLLIAIPIWYLFWSRITKAVASDPKAEHSSPTRRAYLFILFGIGGVVAVISLILGVYFLFQGIFESRFGIETLRRMRIPIGILVSTAAISAYHWTVYRSDRVQQIAVRRGPRLVVLVGPKDPELARLIQREIGARIEWKETLDGVWSWDSERVLDTLREADQPSLLVLAENSKALPLKI